MNNVAILRYKRFFLMKKGNINKILYFIMSILDFYERVKSLAKTKKTTIEYVVGEAGLSLASYNAYRRHENLPRADEALKIAKTLGTTVEFLITGIIPEPDTSDKVLIEIQTILDLHWNNSYKSIPHKT